MVNNLQPLQDHGAIVMQYAKVAYQILVREREREYDEFGEWASSSVDDSVVLSDFVG